MGNDVEKQVWLLFAVECGFLDRDGASSFLHSGVPLGEPSPFAERGEKVAGGRMRGATTLAHARHPSPQPSPLAPQRERESKACAFVALLPFCCLLVSGVETAWQQWVNGLRAQGRFL